MSNYLKNYTGYERKFLCEIHGEKKCEKCGKKINLKLYACVRAESLKERIKKKKKKK